MNSLEGVIFALNKIGANPVKTKAHEVEFSYELLKTKLEYAIEIFFKRIVDSKRIRIIKLSSDKNSTEGLIGSAAEQLMTYMLWAKDYSCDDGRGCAINVYSKETIFSKDLDLKLN